MRGVRRFTRGGEGHLAPGFVEGVRVLGKVGLTCDLAAGHAQLAAATELVRRCPDVQFMLCHCGVPDIAGGRLESWRADIRELASLPNVRCKMSGLVTSANPDGWTREDLKPAIEHVLECFGFPRTAFGSDWPVMLKAARYPAWVEALRWAVSGCTEEELRRLFRDSAIEFYRIGPRS